MKQIEVVAAIIHDSEGRIFATQRGYGEWKDWWEFPGGKIEAGETPEEALQREIWEELETRIVVERLVETVEWDYPAFGLRPSSDTTRQSQNEFHSALAAKAAEGKVQVFEALAFNAPKTKDLLAVLNKAGLEQRNALFLVSEADKNLYLSSNNIPWCRCARVADVNTYDIVRANNVVISQAALAELEGGR